MDQNAQDIANVLAGGQPFEEIGPLRHDGLGTTHHESGGLAEAGTEPSVGSVGDSYDNVLAETIIGLYQREVIRRPGPWRNLEAVEFATLEWVGWFNDRRLLESIGDPTPGRSGSRILRAKVGHSGLTRTSRSPEKPGRSSRARIRQLTLDCERHCCVVLAARAGRSDGEVTRRCSAAAFFGEPWRAEATPMMMFDHFDVLDLTGASRTRSVIIGGDGRPRSRANSAAKHGTLVPADLRADYSTRCSPNSTADGCVHGLITRKSGPAAQSSNYNGEYSTTNHHKSSPY